MESPAPYSMEGTASRSDHQAALEVWQRWRRAKHRRARDAAVFELWQCCESVIWRAASEISTNFGKHRHVTVREWLFRHGLEEDDVRYAAFPAVRRAAESFRPDRGAAFQTYAYGFVVGEIHKSVSRGDALNFAGELREDIRDDGEDGATIEQRPDMWRLLELDPSNGGPGRYSDLGALTNRLDPGELMQVHGWLEENQERAIEQYGIGRYSFVHFLVGFVAWVEQFPPEVRRAPWSRTGLQDGLPIQAQALRTDGKQWDLMLPVRAEQLLRSGLSERAVARRLEMPWSTYKDMRARMKEQSFASSKFTLNDLEGVVRGNKKRGRPPTAQSAFS